MTQTSLDALLIEAKRQECSVMHDGIDWMLTRGGRVVSWGKTPGRVLEKLLGRAWRPERSRGVV